MRKIQSSNDEVSTAWSLLLLVQPMGSITACYRGSSCYNSPWLVHYLNDCCWYPFSCLDRIPSGMAAWEVLMLSQLKGVVYPYPRKWPKSCFYRAWRWKTSRLVLDDLAGTVPKDTTQTRLASGLFAVLWITFLIVAGELEYHTWHLLE